MKRLTYLIAAGVMMLAVSVAIPANGQAPGDRLPDHYVVRLQPGADSAAVAARAFSPLFVILRR